jgi:nucleotide-binding universal stress UspA family protein
MYTHGRTGIKHFFKGSIAEDVVNHANVPVFTFVED